MNSEDDMWEIVSERSGWVVKNLTVDIILSVKSFSAGVVDVDVSRTWRRTNNETQKFRPKSFGTTQQWHIERSRRTHQRCRASIAVDIYPRGVLKQIGIFLSNATIGSKSRDRKQALTDAASSFPTDIAAKSSVHSSVEAFEWWSDRVKEQFLWDHDGFTDIFWMLTIFVGSDADCSVELSCVRMARQWKVEVKN